MACGFDDAWNEILMREAGALMDGLSVHYYTVKGAAWKDKGPSTGDALVAGLTLNILNRRSDRLRVANIAQTVNVLQAMILTDGPRMILTPTYHVFARRQGGS